jgi:Acetyl xylan esterase (AXE1)
MSERAWLAPALVAAAVCIAGASRCGAGASAPAITPVRNPPALKGRLHIDSRGPAPGQANANSDPRLAPLKDLDGDFPFEPPSSREAWAARAEQVRRRILVALGLWPMPPRTPLNAVVHGRIDRDGYTVERVYFESYPGHFVTGSLYRPTGQTARRPAVLSPHGHWPNGRFQSIGDAEVARAIETGAERHPNAARHILQARMVQLARMGLVGFLYDMVGYSDSVQIPMAVAHGFRDARPDMNDAAGWGFFSPRAELRLQSIMGLQAWNTVRALDFLESLPDVDAARIAVTGASGGGTQTFVLGAIDQRPAVIFPAVMVSTAMQGGCTCENADYLRIGTGNVEIAALFAPKPLGMTAADDWTKAMSTRGFPELQRLYALLGAPDHVALFPFLQFGHNYNAPSRGAMYGFLNRHLTLGLREPIDEIDFLPLTRDELTVWDATHPTPPSGVAYERSLTRTIDELSGRELATLMPRNRDAVKRYRDVVGAAWDTMLGRRLEAVGSVSASSTASAARPGGAQLRREADGEQVVISRHPASGDQVATVIWLTDVGDSGLYDRNGALRPEVRRLRDSGCSVIGADLLLQGERDRSLTAPLVKNPRAFAGYTYGYNPPLFARRVHDVLTLIAHARGRPRERVIVVGLGGASLVAAAAAAQSGGALRAVALQTLGARFDQATAIDDPGLMPGAVKYGGLPGLLALAAPTRAWVSDEGSESFELADAAYGATAAPGALTLKRTARDGDLAALVEWVAMEARR